MQLPEFLEGRASEIIGLESIAAERRMLWAVVLGLKPSLDGNKWCILWGDDLQVGVVGWGASPSEAIQAFEYAMIEKVNTRTLPAKAPATEPKDTLRTQEITALVSRLDYLESEIKRLARC